MHLSCWRFYPKSYYINLAEASDEFVNENLNTQNIFCRSFADFIPPLVHKIIVTLLILFRFLLLSYTSQKIKFSIKDFFSKWGQIRRKLRIWSHLLKKSLMENFIFCIVSFDGEFINKWWIEVLNLHLLSSYHYQRTN